MTERLLAALLLLCSLTSTPLWAQGAQRGVTLAGARLWPAQDYTRLTLEARSPLRWTLFSVESPERLVLDLEGVEPGTASEALPARVRPEDPWVRAIRVGRFKPGVLRVVLDLKAAVKASASLLEPAGEYGYRLVVDIYPAAPVDPLMALLQERERSVVRAAADGRDAAEGAVTGPAGGGVSAPAAAAPTLVPAATDSGEAIRPAQEPALASPAAPVAGAPNSGAGGQTAGVTGGSGSGSGTGSASTAGAPRSPAPAVTSLTSGGPAGAAVAGNSRELLFTIAIDAGHGGEDPGAHGESGTLEKDVTLAVAHRLRDRVNAEPNLRGVLVRDGDYFIPLGGRTAKARQLRADLFVSIHADAFISKEARGSSVFALSERGATSVAARWLANRENQADQIGGINLNARDPYLAQTLFDLSQTATIQDSLRLARAVLRELGGLNPLHKGEVEQAGFAVLKSPDIPSILVETAFISNPFEEKRLSDPAYQSRLADTILRGIKLYLQSRPAQSRARLSLREAAP